MANLSGTDGEKYLSRRAWATPELKTRLDELGLYKQYVANCKKPDCGFSGRFHTSIATAFSWIESNEGITFWSKLSGRL